MISLRRHLLSWLLIPLALAVVALSGFAWIAAARSADAVQDQLLLGSALVIGEALRFEDGAYQHPIPPAALELFQSAGEDRTYYRITADDQGLLAGDAALPEIGRKQDDAEPAYFVAKMRGDPVRVVAITQSVIGAADEMRATVHVAQTRHMRDRTLRRLWLQATAEQLLIIAVAVVCIVFGLRRGLRPVLQLRDELRTRRPDTFEPLPSHKVPAELVPLVDLVNEQMEKLEKTTRSRQVFIENAAHQLRTPLTVLATQISFASRTSDEKDRAESLVALRRTLQHAIRMVNQLLTMAAAQDSLAMQRHTECVALSPLVQQVLESMAGQAEANEIDLGLEITVPDATVNCDSHMLREMVLNLVHNAILYTPRGGCVTARIARDLQTVCIVIEDNGPGIAPEQRERVFERFYRLENGDSSGSGLGFSIVREFARAIGRRGGASRQPKQDRCRRLDSTRQPFGREWGLNANGFVRLTHVFRFFTIQRVVR